ncbi:hypothetical protein B2G71_06655 [Novosphingobium sp. PC22D]|uniref:DUF465 domain-containing protein n=1 Tax=Novosphingobium sp. PC22D TaxID=1962403 RepID=UPI000BF12287|nr:DUF465 domain-containing protein [Novosphingobium sp. PC22D]PEQ13971.1 hypothetical protein B2G71_06655 [Novosphingobium sp. PC22D]
MTDRFFRLLERLQRTDGLLRRIEASRTGNPLLVARLRRHKQALRARLSRLQAYPPALPGL